MFYLLPIASCQTTVSSVYFEDGKMWENIKRVIFNSLFEYFEEHSSLSAHQSGFGATGSCLNQLLSIVHDICTAFDAYPTLKSRSVFLDMSKLLIRYSMKDLYSDLNQWEYLILYQVCESCFKWPDVSVATCKSRYTTRIYIRSSFFLIYINDLSNDIIFTIKFFSDDISLFSNVLIFNCMLRLQHTS